MSLEDWVDTLKLMNKDVQHRHHNNHVDAPPPPKYNQ